MEETDFKKDIVEYLHLEYGETPDDPESLKPSDIKYVGQYLFEGFPTHFWWYPSGSEQCWATVVYTDEIYNIGMTTKSPDTLKKFS